jgi:uncharacterized membrane protein YfcA
VTIAALFAGLFSGIIGAMGLGGGAVLIIYLAVFTETAQLKAQGINLLFFLPVGLIAVIIYAIKRKIKWKTVLFMAAGGVVGAVLGLALTDTLGGNMTAKLFGALLVFLGAKEIFCRTNKKENNTLKKG